MSEEDTSSNGAAGVVGEVALEGAVREEPLLIACKVIRNWGEGR